MIVESMNMESYISINYTSQNMTGLVNYTSGIDMNITTTTSPIEMDWPTPTYNKWTTGILGLLAALTSLCTTLGNIMVVIAFVMERGIRQPSNYLIASLAVTDILIGSLSMPLYTSYLLAGHWALGRIVCDLWLSLDYTVCLVSQYTVFLITLDRFCSVKIPAQYRNWRSKRKIKVMIAITWVLPTAIFFTSIIGWHNFVEAGALTPGECTAMFQKDKIFSAVLVISYYWITLIVMMGLYAGIYQVTWKLHVRAKRNKERIRKATQVGQRGGSKSPENGKVDSGGSNGSVSGTTQSTQTTNCIPEQQQQKQTVEETNQCNGSNPSESTDTKHPVPNSLNINESKALLLTEDDNKLKIESPVWKPRPSLPNISIHWNAFTGHTHHALNHSGKQDGGANDLDYASLASGSPKSPRSQRSQISDNYDSASETSDSDNKPRVINQLASLLNNFSQQRKTKSIRRPPKPTKSKTENRAQKALRTITFILGAFVICWTPYHVIILIESFCKNPDGCVNVKLYEFSYWLCYINSPINPFCYALANQQFKKAFTKILKGVYIRNWWRRTH